MINSINKKVLAIAVSTAFCALAANAHAEGWYVGVGVGGAHNGKSNSRAAADAASALVNAGYSFNNFGSGLSGNMTDQNATGLKLFGGKQINRYLSIEGQFQNVGKTKSSFSGTVDGPEGAVGTTTYESKAFGGAVVGTLPISKDFSAFGKLGMLHWRSEASTNATVGTSSPSTVSRTEKDNGNDAYYGLGVNYKINPIAGLRVEWERSKIHSGNTDLFSANIVFGF